MHQFCRFPDFSCTTKRKRKKDFDEEPHNVIKKSSVICIFETDSSNQLDEEIVCSFRRFFFLKFKTHAIWLVLTWSMKARRIGIPTFFAIISSGKAALTAT